MKFVKQHELHPEYCDGCMAGVANDKDEPLKKQWTLMSSFPLPHIRDIGECDGTHSHGESRGKVLKLAESIRTSNRPFHVVRALRIGGIPYQIS